MDKTGCTACPLLDTHNRCVAAGRVLENMERCPTMREADELRGHSSLAATVRIMAEEEQE